MTDPHSRHHLAVNNAAHAIGEVQDAIAVVTDRQESAAGAVIMAVGQNPHVESAQNALNFIAQVRTKAEEMNVLCQQAKAEVERYGGGF